MVFRLAISTVEDEGTETRISGRVTEGAYFGPELVGVPLTDGGERRTWILNHSLAGALAWPVQPENDVVLTVSIPRDDSSSIDRTRPLIGCGAIIRNRNRKDISTALADPRFWAMELADKLEAEDCQKPEGRYFGLDRETLDAYYEETIHGEHHRGAWPFLRVALTADRFVEVELAASVEPQRRFWIGDGTSADPILMGYHSGHFSLPAFRLEEIEGLVRETSHEAVRRIALLLCTACYVREPSPALEALVATLLESVPGFRPSLRAEAATIMVANNVVAGTQWRRDPALGWINDGTYSQRNPNSPLCVLGEEDFGAIERFFAAMTKP